MTKTLEELKEENKKAAEQEEAKLKAPASKGEEDKSKEEDDLSDKDTSDKDADDKGLEGDDEEDKSKTEEENKLWLDTGDPDKKDDEDYVPVGAHVEMKKKLRGRLSEKDSELENLRKENEALRLRQPQERKIRPNPDDFTDQATFDKALDEFKDWEVTDRMRRVRVQDEQQAKMAHNKKVLTERLDAHYDRAAALLTKSGIAPELFKHSDATVRKMIESVRPGMGDIITDSLISTLGEGSEKVMHYMGVNETGRNKLQSLLLADPTGLRAAVFLGQEKQRLTIPIKHRSSAPAPNKHIEGDVNSDSAKGLRRKYEAAHKKHDLQLAYNLKQQAKKSGVDTKNW